MPVWLTIILALGGSAAISTVIGILINKIFKHVDNKNAEQKEIAKELKERQEREEKENEQKAWMNEVRNILVPIRSTVTNIQLELNSNKDATVLNLRVQMKDLKDRYAAQGYADEGDKAMWRELYSQYREMGGNHFKEYVDGWKNCVENLPSTPDEGHDRRNN